MRTFGVEEELLIVDPADGRLLPLAGELLAVSRTAAGTLSVVGDPVLAVDIRFESGALSSEQVEAWANAVESREDIDLCDDEGGVLVSLIFELANPVLTQSLDLSRASHLIDLL